MYGRSKTQAVKESAASGTDLAVSLAQDKKFRKQLLSAVGHGAAARERAASRIGLIAAVTRLATDKELRNELRQMSEGLQNAWTRVEKKRSHKLRNFLLVIGGIGAAVAATRPQARNKVSKLGDVVSSGPIPRTITETIEVDVPVSTAYNQWTQFEDFPLFMEGVEHVRADRRHAPALGRQGRRQDERVGREDPRAASRQAGQLDQRRRQEDAWHGHVRADRRVADADHVCR